MQFPVVGVSDLDCILSVGVQCALKKKAVTVCMAGLCGPGKTKYIYAYAVEPVATAIV